MPSVVELERRMNKTHISVLLLLAASLLGGCTNASSGNASSATDVSTTSQSSSDTLSCQQFIDALTQQTPTLGPLLVKQEENRCYVTPENGADINTVKSALFYQQWGGEEIEKIGRGVNNVQLQSDFVSIYFELL